MDWVDRPQNYEGSYGTFYLLQGSHLDNSTLKTLKDVRANCFCASLLRTQIHMHVIHRARALSTKMNNDRADGHCCSFDWI